MTTKKAFTRALAAAAAIAAGLTFTVSTTLPADAVGKTTIKSCHSGVMSANSRSMSLICDTAGDTHRFQVKCSNGVWVSSPWTRDRARGIANCGTRGTIVGVGATVYYQCYAGRMCPV